MRSYLQETAKAAYHIYILKMLDLPSMRALLFRSTTAATTSHGQMRSTLCITAASTCTSLLLSSYNIQLLHVLVTHSALCRPMLLLLLRMIASLAIVGSFILWHPSFRISRHGTVHAIQVLVDQFLQIVLSLTGPTTQDGIVRLFRFGGLRVCG